MYVISSEFTAACASDPEVFFKKDKRSVATAKGLCGSCRIRLACLENALDYERTSGEQLLGVHGGLTPAERTNTTFRRIDGGTSPIQREVATHEREGLAVAGA
jgi:hypothetical protein